MDTLLGLIMIYAWIHSIVICAKRIKNTTPYEKIVLWVGVVAFGLYIIGTLIK